MSSGIDLMERVREECISLLDSARFSTWRDLHLKGELATVSILVRPEERPDGGNPDTCRVMVICQAAGHLLVEWDRVPLELLDTESQRVLFRDVLDSRGRALFKVPYGGPQERYLRFRHPEPPDVEFEFAAELLALAAAGPDEPDELPRLKKSGRLSVELTLVPERTLRITVDALDVSLRSSAVVVDILSKRTGVVGYSATVPLEYSEGLRGILDIQSETLGFSVDEILRVEVRSKTS